MGGPICFRTTLIITLLRISGLELVTLLMNAFLHANSSVSIPRLLQKSTDWHPCSRRTFILLYHQHIIVLQPSLSMSQQRAATLSSSVFVKNIKHFQMFKIAQVLFMSPKASFFFYFNGGFSSRLIWEIRRFMQRTVSWSVLWPKSDMFYYTARF